MPELHGSLSVPLIAMLAAAAGSFAAAVYAYRTTVPPVPPLVRWILIGLRTAALFLILLLLGEPVLSIRHHATERPGLLVLVDNSRSMTLRDRTGDRAEHLRDALRSPMFRRLQGTADVRTAVFDRTARPLAAFDPDSLSLDGAVTDMAAAFRYAHTASAASNIRAVLLMSDGVPTEGPTPIYEALDLGVPVFTVGIGDTAEPRDLSVRRVQTNEIAYVGTALPVRALLHSSGFGGEHVEVTARMGGQVLGRSALDLGTGSQDYALEFKIIPPAEGRQVITVDVSPLVGELTDKNNRFDVPVQVLRSKMRVLLVAGGPGPDAAFIRRTLESDQNIDLHPYTETAAGTFTEGALTPSALRQADCLVLIGYPRAASDPMALSAVAQAADAGIPVFLVLGRTVDAKALSALSPALPFTVRDPQPSELQVFAAIPESKRLHVLFRSDGADVWPKLPPIFRWQSGFTAKPEAEVLALVRYQNTVVSEPLILLRNVAQRKSLAITGYGLWRWKMMGDAAAGTDKIFERFIGNAVRWLTTREDARPIRVQAVRPTFTAAEQVEFAGDVYDATYRPIENATVSVTVRGGGRTREVPLLPLGNGQYSGSMEPLPQGTYTTSATVSLGVTVVGSDSGAFSVGAMTVEFLETRMNKPLLEQIAGRTGGRYADAASIGMLEQAIRTSPGFEAHDRVRNSEVQVWNAEWAMGLVVTLFAAEWMLRKRRGMM